MPGGVPDHDGIAGDATILRATGLSNTVGILEITVEPGRDSPERMEAFARLPGTNRPPLTGSRTARATFWHYFGINNQKMPEGSSDPHRLADPWACTSDVDHTDGFVVMDNHLHEQVIAGGMTSGGLR